MHSDFILLDIGFNNKYLVMNLITNTHNILEYLKKTKMLNLLNAFNFR